MPTHERAGGEAIHVAIALIRLRLSRRGSRAREGGRWVDRWVAVRCPVRFSIHRRAVHVFDRPLDVQARRPQRARALTVIKVIAVVPAHV